MIRAFNEEFLAAIAPLAGSSAERVAAERAEAWLKAIGATVFVGRLFAHPIVFDRDELAELGAQLERILSAQIKIIDHLRATRSDEAVLAMFGMAPRLAPFVRWDNLHRADTTITRFDVIPVAGGYACCEINVFPAVGGAEAASWSEMYLHALGLPTTGLPRDPIAMLAAHYSAQIQRHGFTRFVVLESAVHGSLGYPQQVALADHLRAGNPGLEVAFADERTYDPRWLARAEGERTIVHRMFTCDEVSDDFAFLTRLYASGATLAGFESDLRMSKRFLALFADPAYQDLFDADERAAIARLLPRCFALDEANFESAIRDREHLVFKWVSSASYGGAGVLIGSEQPADELARQLRASGVEHWICQRAVEADSLAMRGSEDAAPLDYRLVLGVYSYGGAIAGVVVRGSRESRKVNVSSATGRIGWAFAVSDDTRRALCDHLRDHPQRTEEPR